jgi:glutaredoxin 3
MKAIVWSKPACAFCEKAKSLLKMKGIEYEERNIAQGWKVQDLLEAAPNAKTMPQIWLDDKYVGGYYELEAELNGTS